MKYEGDNNFLSNSVSILNDAYNNGAKGMMDELIASRNAIKIKNIPATDRNGNVLKSSFQFSESLNGGGDLCAAALNNPKVSIFNKVESIVQELFHGLQYLKGQGGASIFNEVEANVYSNIVANNWMNNTDNFGAGGATGLGNETAQGAKYHEAFYNLLQNFSENSFVDAVKSFKTGSAKNSSGSYNDYPLRRSNQKVSILKRYYPLR
jgi:hypothetical protein